MKNPYSIGVPQTPVRDTTFDFVTPFRQGQADSLAARRAALEEEENERARKIFSAQEPYLNRLAQAETTQNEQRAIAMQDSNLLQRSTPEYLKAVSPLAERNKTVARLRKQVGEVKRNAPPTTVLPNGATLGKTISLLEQQLAEEEADLNKIILPARETLSEAILQNYESVREFISKGDIQGAFMAYNAMERKLKNTDPTIMTPQLQSAFEAAHPENVLRIYDQEKQQKAVIDGKAKGIEKARSEVAFWEALGESPESAEELVRMGSLPAGMTRGSAKNLIESTKIYRRHATDDIREGNAEGMLAWQEILQTRMKEAEKDKTMTTTEKKEHALQGLLPNSGLSKPGEIAETLTSGWYVDTFGREMTKQGTLLMDKQTSILSRIFAHPKMEPTNKITKESFPLYNDIMDLVKIDLQLAETRGVMEYSVPTLAAMMSLTGDAESSNRLLNTYLARLQEGPRAKENSGPKGSLLKNAINRKTTLGLEVF